MQKLQMDNNSNNNWQQLTVDDCFPEIINGTTLTQNETSGYPVTRIETIQNDRFDFKRIKYLNTISPQDIEKFKYQIGDIALSHINSLEHVGKVAIYEGQPIPLIHGMNLLRLRPNQALLRPKYAYYYMRSIYFKNDIQERVGKAVNQVSINQKIGRAHV